MDLCNELRLFGQWLPVLQFVKFSAGHCIQTFHPYFWHTCGAKIVIGITDFYHTDFYHFIPLQVTLTFPGELRGQWKAKLIDVIAHFSTDQNIVNVVFKQFKLNIVILLLSKMHEIKV